VRLETLVTRIDAAFARDKLPEALRAALASIDAILSGGGKAPQGAGAEAAAEPA
jgi:hypothetical protein